MSSTGAFGEDQAKRLAPGVAANGATGQENMIEHAYLSDPSFAEPNAGPWLEAKCGHELPVRDPSPDQIQRRCLAIRRCARWASSPAAGHRT